MDLNSLPSLRETVDSYDLMAKKALGQNFLLDRNITDKIISLSLEKQNLHDFKRSYIFEVGPGPGGLTRSILAKDPEKLTVVELDNRCIAIANEIKAVVGKKLEVLNQDALKFDFHNIGQPPRHIISNLPYNISVPLLIKWLKHIEDFSSLTLMFQKEVADRIAAPINTKDYGRISILSQLLCRIDRLIDLNPKNFTPAPKVWSTVLLFRPLETKIPKQAIEKLEQFTNLAFNQRRKMIRSSLKSVPNLEEKCAQIGIATSLRAEQIPPEQFLALALS